MKKWRNIVIFISVITGIAMTIWMPLSSPNFKVAINDPVTQEDYNYLEECALKVAETADTKVIKDENVTSFITFDKEFLYVTVVLMQYNTDKCRIDAKYPITFDENIKIQNADIQIKGSIDYQNAIYTQHSDILHPIVYVCLAILSGIVLGGLIYFLFYYVPIDYGRQFPKKNK